MIVRCLDNTMVRHELTIGREYEVAKVETRDGYYVLAGGRGRFSMSRFEVVKTKPAIRCKCGAKLDAKGICPALCKPVPLPQPAYKGPEVVGSTHIGRMARP